jgi:hypothetical protein
LRSCSGRSAPNVLKASAAFARTLVIHMCDSPSGDWPTTIFYNAPAEASLHPHRCEGGAEPPKQ